SAMRISWCFEVMDTTVCKTLYIFARLLCRNSITQLCERIATFLLVLDNTIFVAKHLFSNQQVIMAYEPLMSSVCDFPQGLWRLPQILVLPLRHARLGDGERSGAQPLVSPLVLSEQARALCHGYQVNANALISCLYFVSERE